jgi:hypothetical protein
MNLTNLRPANELAQRFGVKSVIYGGPGSGKTPLVDTCPTPVMLVVEPGMLSMRTSRVPCFEGNSAEKCDEFWQWFFQSSEPRKFDTLAIDSLSQMAETYLTRELGRWKDGSKAYGEMSRHVMDIVNRLYYTPQKHLYMICKQGSVEENGGVMKRPYFPGQDLNVKIPHLFDEIWHIGLNMIPGVQGAQLSIRTRSSFDTMARDRSARLNELEPPNIGALFLKAMS